MGKEVGCSMQRQWKSKVTSGHYGRKIAMGCSWDLGRNRSSRSTYRQLTYKKIVYCLDYSPKFWFTNFQAFRLKFKIIRIVVILFASFKYFIKGCSLQCPEFSWICSRKFARNPDQLNYFYRWFAPDSFHNFSNLHALGFLYDFPVKVTTWFFPKFIYILLYLTTSVRLILIYRWEGESSSSFTKQIIPNTRTHI